jgi:hypothetical protein
MVATGIMIGLMVGGMVLQAYQQHKAGQAAQKGAEGQAAVSESEAQLAEYNAGVAGWQAQDAIERGVQEEAKYRRQVQGIVGAQRAGFAASNVDVGFGSAVDVQADAAYLGELDALKIRNNAAREAWGYKVSAWDLTQRAAIARQGGEMQIAAGAEAARAGNWAAATTIVGGSSSLLMQRYGWSGSGGTRTGTVHPMGPYQ